MRKLLVIFVVALTLASVAAVGKGWKWGTSIVKNGAEQAVPYDGWTWDEPKPSESD